MLLKSLQMRHKGDIYKWLIPSVLLGSLLVESSRAALFNLVDNNSLAQFDTANQVNNFSWFVDGNNQLASEAFWFRIGNVGGEQSVHTLPIGVQGTTDGNFDGNPDTLFVRYLGAGFKIETKYTLAGGTPGSGSSDMGEQISIVNLSASPLDFHFFEYADFNLSGGPDSAVFQNINTVDQSNPSFNLTETVVTPPASHREIAFFPVTLTKLNDGLPTTLSDTPLGVIVGPGDVTWAYQWDFLLQPGDTFIISKDKNIGIPPIPEPGIGALLSIGFGLLVSASRKRGHSA